MLYLVDEPMADLAWRTVAGDDDATIVLVQDGVFLEPQVDAQIFAIRKDVDVRGVDLPSNVEVVTYDAVVEMMVEQEVKSFV